ncbi:hypothetical protein [Allosphingosinicella deserti]|uniref:Uncharacterized protein n=1 Tax=Allosphingosinicella deserti TaxID=2116704 RepID=A0A2P7QNN1_9SPHN|nr:hypothetical protein [Sphingomonas deserti]PSJ39558.1 hypothetical protein C7I55_13205 [Sphingomonas deserti]
MSPTAATPARHRPLFGTILRGWFAFVFPFDAATSRSPSPRSRSSRFRAVHPFLAELDAFVSTGALFAALLRNVTVFRWVSGEVIPAPRPFGIAAPDAELVAQARPRLPVLMARMPKVRHG